MDSRDPRSLNGESCMTIRFAFQDPTQERQGIDAYIAAQDGLMKRCDDIYLVPGAISINENIAFIEWEMGLKIKGIEFIYPGVSRLRDQR